MWGRLFFSILLLQKGIRKAFLQLFLMQLYIIIYYNCLNWQCFDVSTWIIIAVPSHSWSTKNDFTILIVLKMFFSIKINDAHRIMWRVLCLTMGFNINLMQSNYDRFKTKLKLKLHTTSKTVLCHLPHCRQLTKSSNSDIWTLEGKEQYATLTG